MIILPTYPHLDDIYCLMAKMEQRFSEAKYLYDFVSNYHIRRVLDIGTSQGGTATLFALAGADVVTVDKNPVIEYAWNDLWVKEKYPQLPQKITKIVGDSNDPIVIRGIQDMGPFDFVWIDGGHQGEVISDWKNFKPIASRFVGFHDIINKDDYVHKLWTTIQTTHTTVSYSSHTSTQWGGTWGYGNGGGIGIVEL